jgi:hypothetical protein
VEGEWCDRPGRQNPRCGEMGGKVNILSGKKLISAVKEFLKLLSQMKEN